MFEAPNLRVDATVTGDQLTVRFVGEFDLGSTQALDMVNTLDLEGVTHIVLDFTALEFLDSSAVKALLHLHEKHTGANRSVAIRHVQPQVRRIFEILGLERTFGL
jgi:anti-anti-sigma factor